MLTAAREAVKQKARRLCASERALDKLHLVSNSEMRQLSCLCKIYERLRSLTEIRHGGKVFDWLHQKRGMCSTSELFFFFAERHLGICFVKVYKGELLQAS